MVVSGPPQRRIRAKLIGVDGGRRHDPLLDAWHERSLARVRNRCRKDAASTLDHPQRRNLARRLRGATARLPTRTASATPAASDIGFVNLDLAGQRLVSVLV